MNNVDVNDRVFQNFLDKHFTNKGIQLEFLGFKDNLDQKLTMTFRAEPVEILAKTIVVGNVKEMKKELNNQIIKIFEDTITKIKEGQK